jgi:hypothetical protein
MSAEPKIKLTRSQAFFHRHRWARYALYTLAILAHVLVVSLVNILGGTLCQAWGDLCYNARLWWHDLRRLAFLYKADWQQWDEIEDNYEESDDASD